MMRTPPGVQLREQNTNAWLAQEQLAQKQRRHLLTQKGPKKEKNTYLKTDQRLLIDTLRNRTAGRLWTAESRNVTRDRECSVPRDIFSSFCRPESSSRPVA